VATILASTALVLAAILNVVATSMLLRSDFESRFQKAAQMVLIWVVPVVGAILVMAVLRNSTTVWKPPPSSDGDLNRHSGNQSDPWGGSGGEGHGGDGGFGVIERKGLRPKHENVVSAAGAFSPSVMRAGVLAFAVVLTGCAANPRTLCGSLVPNSWTLLLRAPEGTRDLEASLPQAPYQTNEGRWITSVQRLWYEKGDGLIACTLARHATDNCSVRVTEFARSGGAWVKVSDDAYLCHIIL